MIKIRLALSVIILVVMCLFVTGCKKYEGRTFVLSAITDTTGAVLTAFTYNSKGQLEKLEGQGCRFDYIYSGGLLVERRYTHDSIAETRDSFWYNTSGEIFKIETYVIASGKKNSTTTFTYNADHTPATATVNYTALLTHDELYNYEYIAGQLIKCTTSAKPVATYLRKSEMEFLAYDNHVNPFYGQAMQYPAGRFTYHGFTGIYPNSWASPNNFTQVRVTDYDVHSGNEISTSRATAAYTYNSNGLPVQVYYNAGAGQVSYKLEYEELK